MRILTKTKMEFHRDQWPYSLRGSHPDTASLHVVFTSVNAGLIQMSSWSKKYAAKRYQHAIYDPKRHSYQVETPTIWPH